MAATQFVELTETDRGLEITLLPGDEVREDLEELIAYGQEHTWGSDVILGEILEQNICNSEWELVRETDYAACGALTSAPLLSQEIERDDRGDEILLVGKVYWYARYEISDPIAVLLKEGKVIFDKGWEEDNK